MVQCRQHRIELKEKTENIFYGFGIFLQKKRMIRLKMIFDERKWAKNTWSGKKSKVTKDATWCPIPAKS